MGETDLEPKLHKLIHEILIPYGSLLKHGDDPKEGIILGLYLSILELSESIKTLTEASLAYHAYPLVRTSLEALVDLKLLIEKPRYLEKLELDYYRSRRRFLKSALNEKFEIFGALRESVDLKRELSEASIKINELHKKGVRKTDIKEKFISAGMESEYIGIYQILCDFSHNNLKAIDSRHFGENENEGLEIRAFNHNSDVAKSFAIQRAANILVESSILVHREWGTDKVDYLEKILTGESEI